MRYILTLLVLLGGCGWYDYECHTVDHVAWCDEYDYYHCRVRLVSGDWITVHDLVEPGDVVVVDTFEWEAWVDNYRCPQIRRRGY